MSIPYGQTRTRIARRHALIAPEGHVKSEVPGITGAATIILINPALGAKFAQLLLTFETGGGAAMPANELQTVGYFETGGGVVTAGGAKQRVAAGVSFFSPAGESWSISSRKRGSRVSLFQKKFAPLEGQANPKGIIGDATTVPGEPLLGDPDVRLQTLLPDRLA